MNFKRNVLVTGAALAFSGVLAFANPSETKAAEYTPETWKARTVQEIKEDIKANEKGSKYVFQWGDTLSAIADATGLSVRTLSNVNNISNADMIMSGNSIHLSADHKVMTVSEGEEVKSYDVSNEEVVEVETPVENIAEYDAIEEEKTAEIPAETTVEEVAPERPAAPVASSEGYTLSVEATAYSRNEPGLTNFTYTGIDLRQNPGVVAVDPSVIPLGSTVIVPGYGTYVAGDTGSAIIGNRIDVHIENLDAVWAFGRRPMEITVIPAN